MALELAHPDPRYAKVHLIEPAPLGYLHLAADLQALTVPAPSGQGHWHGQALRPAGRSRPFRKVPARHTSADRQR